MGTNEFKDRLKIAINGESINSFASNCGLPESLLRKYLSGPTLPGTDKLIAIARTAGVSTEWLATGEGLKQRAAVSVGEYFKNRLKMKVGNKVTPEWLSDRSGIPVEKIQAFLGDQAVPSDGEIFALADALGVASIWTSKKNELETLSSLKDVADALITDIKKIPVRHGENTAVSEEKKLEFQLSIFEATLEVVLKLNKDEAKRIIDIVSNFYQSFSEDADVMKKDRIRQTLYLFASAFNFKNYLQQGKLEEASTLFSKVEKMLDSAVSTKGKKS